MYIIFFLSYAFLKFEMPQSNVTSFSRLCSRCSLLGLPDPPVKVELCDWDVDHMDLQWMFPPSDGGAPILLYKVWVLSTVH